MLDSPRAAAFAADVLAFDDDDDVDVDRGFARFRARRLERIAARRTRLLAAAGAFVAVAIGSWLFAAPLKSSARALVFELIPRRFVALAMGDGPDAWKHSALGQVRRATTYRRSGAPNDWTMTSPAAAARSAGFAVRTPALVPPEVAGEHETFLQAPFAWTLSFDSAYARRNGLTMPHSLVGATIRTELGDQIEQRFGHGTIRRIGPFGPPVLVVFQTPTPTVRIRGTTASAIARWFASEPSVPGDAARAMTALADPIPALPIPVHIDHERATPVEVDGTRGLAVEIQLAGSSAVVWQRNGMAYAVGGTYPLDRILAIANSLR